MCSCPGILTYIVTTTSREVALYQVGELYGQSHIDDPQAARRELAYHLNARPSAILDFHDVLEEAGHFVADRYLILSACKLAPCCQPLLFDIGASPCC